MLKQRGRLEVLPKIGFEPKDVFRGGLVGKSEYVPPLDLESEGQVFLRKWSLEIWADLLDKFLEDPLAQESERLEVLQKWKKAAIYIRESAYAEALEIFQTVKPLIDKIPEDDNGGWGASRYSVWVWQALVNRDNYNMLTSLGYYEPNPLLTLTPINIRTAYFYQGVFNIYLRALGKII